MDCELENSVRRDVGDRTGNIGRTKYKTSKTKKRNGKNGKNNGNAGSKARYADEESGSITQLMYWWVLGVSDLLGWGSSRCPELLCGSGAGTGKRLSIRVIVSWGIFDMGSCPFYFAAYLSNFLSALFTVPRFTCIDDSHCFLKIILLSPDIFPSLTLNRTVFLFCISPFSFAIFVNSSSELSLKNEQIPPIATRIRWK